MGDEHSLEEKVKRFPDETLEYYNEFTSPLEVGAAELIEELLRTSSLGGFLGYSESLIDIKRMDYEVLNAHGVSYHKIVENLEKIKEVAMQQYSQSSLKHKRGIVFYLNNNYELVRDEAAKHKNQLITFLKKILLGKSAGDNEKAHFRVSIRKLQDAYCPWSVIPESQKELSALKCSYTLSPNYEIFIENLQNGSSFRFNNLQLHMISEHKFFEGRYTAIAHNFIVHNYYRVEPLNIIKTLELGRNY
ncbi:MAG: hypothetical protein QXW00_02480 [Candidatus Woesearchaeota archaeon]